MDVADSDEVQLHLFRAGALEIDLWAEDPALWELPTTRELFAIASRITYIRASTLACAKIFADSSQG